MRPGRFLILKISDETEVYGKNLPFSKNSRALSLLYP
jgi:hypothetical protein